jgi:AP-2 complex subunit mu-1
MNYLKYFLRIQCGFLLNHKKMISAFFILNGRGDVLISRVYRQDVKRSLSDVFRVHVLAQNIKNPILTLGSTSFYYIKHENLFIVAVSKCNPNAALIFEFLYKIVSLGTRFCNRFDEEAVRENFTLLYEVMDGNFFIFIIM